MNVNFIKKINKKKKKKDDVSQIVKRVIFLVNPHFQASKSIQKILTNVAVRHLLHVEEAVDSSLI